MPAPQARIAAAGSGNAAGPAMTASLACLCLGLSLILGTLWHEVIGHGLTGLICGGRIEFIRILGLDIWPSLTWQGFDGAYGYCDVRDVPTETGLQVVYLAGSLSTWTVSLIALLLLRRRPWKPAARFALICLSLWWIDMFTYTLPTWGLRRSILWGGSTSEPYDAAVALGLPGFIFQALVIISTVLMAFGTYKVLCRQWPLTRPQVPV